ncbi:MAG: DUF3568 family protein [Candidatus Methylomirabilales bacterium]
MTQHRKMAFGLGLLAALLAGCAALGAATSVATTAVGGRLYVRSQTVERTFVAPTPAVKEACRRALTEMAFTIQREETGKNGYRILALASDEYEVEITITPITPKATKVSVKADSLPDRDKATGLEIINQMAATLSPPPPQLFVSPTSRVGRTVPAVHMVRTSPLVTSPLVIEEDRPPRGPGLPSTSSGRTVQPPPPQSPTPIGPLPAATNPEPPAVPLTVSRQAPQKARILGRKPEDTLTLEQTYETAIREYVQGNFPTAIAHLRRYLAAHPDPAEKPRALYWLGESLYSQREYADALLQFETILRDFPRSPEVPRALLKGAHTYHALHETREAARLLRTLITQHPTSREAQVGRPLMAEW